MCAGRRRLGQRVPEQGGHGRPRLDLSGGTRKADRIDENLGALTLDFTAAQLTKLDAAADAVVGSRSADPNWVSQGRE